MKLLIDDARLDNIRRLAQSYPIDGVTTNPSILAKAGGSPFQVLHEIRDFLGDEAELHVQVIASTAQGMIADAHRILQELGKNTYVKIPVVPQGLEAMMALKKEGVGLTATAIYTPMQAFLAGKAGADYAAPYVNRIDNMGYNGIETTKAIHDIFKSNGLPTQVLAASFKNSQQVLELCRHGVGACTVAPDVVDGLIKNAAITQAVEGFTQDFEALAGPGKTMADCQ